MKKGLTIVSVLMLIFGIFTLVTGLMSSALLSAGSDGSTEAKAVIAWPLSCWCWAACWT